MDADAHAAPDVHHVTDERQQRLLPVGDEGGGLAVGTVEVGAPERGQRATGRVPHRLVHAPLVQRVDRLRARTRDRRRRRPGCSAAPPSGVRASPPTSGTRPRAGRGARAGRRRAAPRPVRSPPVPPSHGGRRSQPMTASKKRPEPRGRCTCTRRPRWGRTRAGPRSTRPPRWEHSRGSGTRGRRPPRPASNRCRVRNEPSSSSGLTPVSMRRKVLSTSDRRTRSRCSTARRRSTVHGEVRVGRVDRSPRGRSWLRPTMLPERPPRRRRRRMAPSRARRVALVPMRVDEPAVAVLVAAHTGQHRLGLVAAASPRRRRRRTPSAAGTGRRRRRRTRRARRDQPSRPRRRRRSRPRSGAPG